MTLCQHLRTLMDVALQIGKKLFVGQKWIIHACTTPCTSSAKTRLNLTNWGKRKEMKFCQVKCWSPRVRYTTHPLTVRGRQSSRMIAWSSKTVCQNGNWRAQSVTSGEERKVSKESILKRAKGCLCRKRKQVKPSIRCKKKSWFRGCRMLMLRTQVAKMRKN